VPFAFFSGFAMAKSFVLTSAAKTCLLFLIPCSLCAQDKKGDWKALYGLHSGEKIELIEAGMKKHAGTFATVTEENPVSQ